MGDHQYPDKEVEIAIEIEIVLNFSYFSVHLQLSALKNY